MKLIENSTRYPVSVSVGVILVTLFGVISLFRIPIQLVPNVEEPKITVITVWPGANPQEIEREIIDEQEKQLKSLEGLVKLESSSQENRGTITLTFQVGTPVLESALLVSNRLEQVPSYPDDVDKPVIHTTEEFANVVAWFALAPTENGFQGDPATLWNFADDFIKPAFERVPGVAAASIFGGREQEMQVIVDPARLAARQVTLGEMAAALDRENRNYSGGDFDEGKRKYVVRTVGEYASPAEIENVVVTERNAVPVYVRDVARVQLGYKKPFAECFDKGRRVIYLAASRAPGANSLEVMAGLKKAVNELNGGLLAPRGLQLVQGYDETDYITGAMDLVTGNLYAGSALAILCILLFLRSVSSTLVIATAIPVSVVGAFIVLDLMGRTLNVISLAGMAFAAGQVVDNSIVVLENIFRHRQMGKSRLAATMDGAKEVWGAVVASTVTTIAVFIPVLFVQEEAGQLFADIAIAIASAVGLSLIVCITVVPAMTVRIMGAAEADESGRKGFQNLWGLADWAHRLTRGVGDIVYWINGSFLRRVVVVMGMTAASILAAILMVPKAEYLPTGNTNFAFGIVLPPPGYNVSESASLRHPVEEIARPLWEAKPGTPETLQLPGGGVQTMFYVALPSMSFIGARANDPLRVNELIPTLQEGISKIPGSIGFITQASLFERGLASGRNIEIQIRGPDLNVLIQHGLRVFEMVREKIPGAQALPIPSLDLGNPEVQVLTHRRRSADLKISNRELGFAVNVLVDGAKVSDFRQEGREIDLTLRGEDSYASRTHEIENIPIATEDGRLVTLGSVATIGVSNGPVEIRHSERLRTITIQVNPPEKMPLEAAMDVIRNDIVKPMEADGSLGGAYHVALSGSADKLVQTAQAFRWNFLLAVVITYLLLAALFESFLHPFVIMFSVPLGAVGGFIGLWAMNTFLAYQALDVLTMLGFVILVGIVVNNATLIVHQSLVHINEEGMEPREAIRESVINRMRPMMMTTGTNITGMLPMVIAPGAGSELYRGLGAVITGGMIVSTVFTLFLVPAIFSLTLDLKAALSRRWRGLVGAPSAGD